MEESTALAVPSGGEVAAPAPSAPAESSPLAPERTAVTGDMIPRSYVSTPQPADRHPLNKSGKTSSAEIERLGKLADAAIAEQVADPAPVAWDKARQLTPEYQAWMERQNNKQPARARTPRAVVAKELKDLAESNDSIRETLTIVNDLYNSPTGAAAALNAIIARSPEAFERIRNHVIADNPRLAYMQASLLIGNDVAAAEQPSNELGELAQWIQPDMQETARTVPRGVLVEWVNQGEDALAYNLRQQKDLNTQWKAQADEFNRRWDTAITEARQAGQDQLAELANQHADAHRSELAKWKPAGKDEAANAMIREMAFAGASAALMADPKFAAMDQAIAALISTGPLAELQGDTQVERGNIEARHLARQLSVRFGQMLKERVKLLDTLIKSSMAHAAEEAIKSVGLEPLTPIDESRALRPGEPPRLGKDGKVSATWKEWLGKKVITRERTNQNAS